MDSTRPAFRPNSSAKVSVHNPGLDQVRLTPYAFSTSRSVTMPSNLCTSARFTTGRISISFVPMRSRAQIQTLVGMDVGKNHRIHQLAKLLLRAFGKFSLQSRKVDHANYTSSILHQPGSDFTRSNPFQSLPDSHRGRQQQTRGLHDSHDLTPTRALARLPLRQVYTILHCQGFVDGLMLQS